MFCFEINYRKNHTGSIIFSLVFGILVCNQLYTLYPRLFRYAGVNPWKSQIQSKMPFIMLERDIWVQTLWSAPLSVSTATFNGLFTGTWLILPPNFLEICSGDFCTNKQANAHQRKMWPPRQRHKNTFLAWIPLVQYLWCFPVLKQ